MPSISERLYKLETQVLDVEKTINEMKNCVDQEDNSLDIKSLEQEAISNSFPSHITQSCDGEIAYQYAVLLAMIAETSDDIITKMKQYYHVLRIYHAGKSKEYIGDVLLRDSKISSINDISLLNEIKDDILKAFFVDALLMVSALGMEEKQLDTICELYAYCGIKKEYVEIINEIVKAIYLQDEDVLLGLSKKTNVNMFFSYFGKQPEFFVIDNMKNISSNGERKILIYKDRISDVNEILDIDSFGKSQIIFRKCEFDNIIGMKNDTTEVIFEECKFKNCVQKNELKSSRRDRKYENNMPKTLFMECNGISMINCEFSNCSLLGVGQKSSVFLFRNSKLKNCQFTNCNIGISARSSAEGSVLIFDNTSVDNCGFFKCSAYGEGEYGRFDHFHMRVISAKGGHVCNCNFEKCITNSQDVSDAVRDNYILLFNDRCKESGNDFTECKTSQTVGWDEFKYDLKENRKID